MSDAIDLATLHARTAGGTAIVDCRPLHAYNGWPLAGEPRGGHIPGATAFPVDWVEQPDGRQLRRSLERLERGDSGRVVVHGTGRDDARRVADHLRAVLGHDAVEVFDEGFGAWAGRPELPVERLVRYEHLVHAGWLRERIEARTVAAVASGRPWALFHVQYSGPEEYLEGHLPGAVHLDTDLLEDPADWDRRRPADLERALCALGITRDTTVVLYGRDIEGSPGDRQPGRRAGQIAAARAAAILLWAGVEDVRLLDGGYDHWVRAGLPIETDQREPVPVETFGGALPGNPAVFVDQPDVHRLLADRDGSVVVSVRSWPEQTGVTSGYDFVERKGRIRGDVWGHGGTDAHHMQHYRNVDNTMRAYPEIARTWAAAGITPDKRVAFYCGTGWRASEAWFAAWLQGWERASIYDGGWLDWSLDPANPIEDGDPDAVDDRDGA
ncbi:MAG: rhodanese-like domain-containing protein [Candidatus Limnocylindria bacterium]